MKPEYHQAITELVKRPREETPPALDLRLAIRQQLEQATQSVYEDWSQILLYWASRTRVRASFCTVFATLMFTSYWELSRPEPQAAPPMPTFMIDRLFNE